MVNSRYKKDSNVQMAILPFHLILIIEQGKDEAKPVFSEFTEITGKAAMLMQININSKRGVVIKALPYVVSLLVAASGAGFRGGNWSPTRRGANL